MTPDSRAPGPLSVLTRLIADADSVAEEIGYPGLELRHEYHRHFMMLIAQAHVQLFATHDDCPDWVPHTGALFPWGASNHDTIYAFAPIDPAGVYRISGSKGDEDVASVMLRRGGPNNGQVHGAPLGEIEVAGLSIDADGRFSFLLSRDRPQEYTGDWFALPADTTGVVSRHVTSDAEQVDGTWAIERLDRTPGPALHPPAEVARRTELAAAFVDRLNRFLMTHVKTLRETKMNAFVADKYPDHGGIASQLYYQGAWELDPDEVLIFESELPDRIHYWSVQLLDGFFGAIDTVGRQTALNQKQVAIDSDGLVRFVVSPTDPGVPNWLDTGGWQAGAMLWRWHSGSSYPQPVVRRIKANRLRDALPADTPYVDAAERAARRAERTRHYQTRRRW